MRAPHTRPQNCNMGFRTVQGARDAVREGAAEPAWCAVFLSLLRDVTRHIGRDHEFRSNGGIDAHIAVFVGMDTGGISDILGALLQNGASMSRTSIENLLCPRIPMSW